MEALLDKAQKQGRVLIGGEINREQRRIAPTVIRVDDRRDPLMADELFGPLLPVLELTDLPQTLAEIRQRPKPLALYLFGGNEEKRAMAMTSREAWYVPGTASSS